VIRIIKKYTLGDVKSSILLLLDRASKSPEVRQMAIQITYTEQDKISAIYNWVKQNVSYIPDPIGPTGEEIELFVSPVKMVNDYNQGLRPGGDCDDHALLDTALFRAIGFRSNVVLMNSAGQGIDHAYCRVYSEKLSRWLRCDTSVNTPLAWDYPGRFEVAI
jgi:transglutaminase-like putative cysteine protease